MVPIKTQNATTNKGSYHAKWLDIYFKRFTSKRSCFALVENKSNMIEKQQGHGLLTQLIIDLYRTFNLQY